MVIKNHNRKQFLKKLMQASLKWVSDSIMMLNCRPKIMTTWQYMETLHIIVHSVYCITSLNS